MPDRSGHALARLRSRQPVFGIVQVLPLPTITELALWSGYDFVILDCECGVIDEPAQLTCLQVVSGTGAFAAVRVRPRDLPAVGRYLASGADAVLMPHIETKADAAAFVAAAGRTGKVHTTGGNSRAAHYGLPSGNARPPALLFALIEKREAAARIEEIAATPGLDGIVIGSRDLAADLGCPEDFTAPAYRTVFTAIERAALAAGLLLGAKPHPGLSAAQLIDAGHSLIVATADVVALRNGFRDGLAAAGVRASVGNRPS